MKLKLSKIFDCYFQQECNTSLSKCAYWGNYIHTSWVIALQFYSHLLTCPEISFFAVFINQFFQKRLYFQMSLWKKPSLQGTSVKQLTNNCENSKSDYCTTVTDNLLLSAKLSVLQECHQRTLQEQEVSKENPSGERNVSIKCLHVGCCLSRKQKCRLSST